jgi:hypothetical protein
MRFNEKKNKIGYPCIFSKSTAEAIDNLLRQIIKKQCGFDEGAAVWRTTLKEWLEGDYDLLDLNYCGAAFSEEQWKNILAGIVKGLENHEE